MILAFDTETTGLANFKLPTGHESQPHLVQVGAMLVDEHFVVRGEINMIVKPEGWTIPASASSVHGITQEVAERFGLPKETVLNAFANMVNRATVFVAHNLDFDLLVMTAFSQRCSDVVGRFAGIRDAGFCTMKAMAPICKFHGQYGDYKWPKLTEAYWHAFQELLPDAHDAMADVRACLRLYRWINYQAGMKILTMKGGENNAKAIRSDAGQVQEGRAVGSGGQREGSQNLQFDKEAGPETGDTKT